MPPYSHFFIGEKTEDMVTTLWFLNFKGEVTPALFCPSPFREEAANKLC